MPITVYVATSSLSKWLARSILASTRIPPRSPSPPIDDSWVIKDCKIHYLRPLHRTPRFRERRVDSICLPFLLSNSHARSPSRNLPKHTKDRALSGLKSHTYSFNCPPKKENVGWLSTSPISSHLSHLLLVLSSPAPPQRSAQVQYYHVGEFPIGAPSLSVQ